MVLIKDATEKAINTAILALNDDIEKVKASNSSSSSSGITEGETYNINISGNANTASKVKNALTLNVGGNATSYDGSSAKTVTIGSNAKLTVATTNTYTAASTTEYDGSTAKTATIYTPGQLLETTSSPTLAGLNLTGTSLTVTSPLSGLYMAQCWAKVYGNILRVHIAINMTAMTLYNSTVVFVLNGTLPTMTYAPTRFVLGVDTSNYRYNGGIDIQQDGQCRLYLEDGTNISSSGNIANVIGLYGDCMLTLN